MTLSEQIALLDQSLEYITDLAIQIQVRSARDLLVKALELWKQPGQQARALKLEETANDILVRKPPNIKDNET